MPPVFSPDIIARVKDETDIVEIVRQHVSLKQAGAVFKGLCPFHKEKTPSFIVTPARDRFHCFGCGAGGDVISFLMELEGLSFPEAVEILARPLDLDLSDWLKDDESEGERRAFHRANEAALGIWKDAFWDAESGRAARAYLTGRGFSEQVLRDFDVGWAPPHGGWLESRLAAAGVDQDLALRADLLRRKDGAAPFAYFRGRIIFPIKNISRQVAGFGGRVIDQGEPKYLNSADSPYFAKGHLLYGFDASRMAIARERSAILVEGYLDLLALAQAGYANVVATCGTAFTAEQAKLIRRGAPQAVLLFDGDQAGRKAAVRSADIALRAGLEPRIVSLPQGKDPADLFREQGQAGVHEALGSAVGYVPFLHGLAAARGKDRTLQERAVRQALRTVAGIPDPLRQEYILREAAEVFGLGIDLLRTTVQEIAAKERPQDPGRPRPAGDRAAPRSPAGSGAQGGGGTGHATGGAGTLDLPPGKVRAGTPQVRRSLAQVNARSIEADMFAHILMDPTGAAALQFVERQAALAGALELEEPPARLLGSELAAWAAERGRGPAPSPRDFVLQRWNTAGDQDYRNFISRLIDQTERPAGTDFVRITRDCLQRLQLDRKARQS